MQEVSKVRGTLDKIGTSLRLEEKIIEKITKWLNLYNYSRIETPVIEKASLFIESLGTDTDIVNKEMFFIQTRDDEQICLRPEFTVGIFRAFLEKQGSLLLPWKVFSIGPCFRYERPQKGRWRQFDQVSIELIGGKSIFYDAELILMLDRLFSQIFLFPEYTLKINYIGTAQDRINFRTALGNFLDKHTTELCIDCKKRRNTNTLRCLDCKNENCQNIFINAPKILDYLTPASFLDFEKLKNTLHLNSVNFEVCNTLVRGLDYYEGIVFEFISNNLGSQSTFCGGGRYELSKKFGLNPNSTVPSVGAGIGLGRLCMLLENIEKPKSDNRLIAIIPISDKELEFATILADFLRSHEFTIDIFFDKKPVKSAIKQAEKLLAHSVIFVGEEEVKTGLFTIKNMVTGTEVKATQEKLIEHLL